MPSRLEDVTPELQGGKYKRDFDQIFFDVSRRRGVPFALLKAHAIAESSLDPHAYRAEPARGSRPPSASYGLMQVLFWPGSDRFERYGFERDDAPELLYDPHTNIDVAAQLIRDNLKSCGWNLRDAVNMYNTGVKESVRPAPGGYVNKVIGYYNTILNKKGGVL